MANNRLTCGSLFSGIGGFCFGFKKHGFELLWANDIDPEATKTYAENFQNTEIINDDINNINKEKMLLPHVNVLHAGFPCQSFSVAGNRRGFEDPRGQLFFSIIEFIRRHEASGPDMILLENAPNILFGSNGSWFDTIRLELQRLGYWFSNSNAVILDTHKHGGLPQRRERIFMLALHREKFDFNNFFELQHAPPESMLNLEDMLEEAGTVGDEYFLSSKNKYGHALLEECKKLPKGTLVQLRQSTIRPQQPGVCPTLTANMGMGGHNVPFLIDSGRLRKLTERECLRLQGFPEEFVFPDILKSSKYRLIGNSVSPIISEKLAAWIRENYSATTNGEVSK